MSQPRVLLVESEPQLRQGLEDAGCAVEVASRGAQALALCEQQSFEAVLLDVSLPDMHGLSVLSALREDPRFRNVPIVLLGMSPRPPDIPELVASLRSRAAFRPPPHELMRPPEPSALPALRQRWIAHRFVRWVALLGLAAVMYANLAVGLLALGYAKIVLAVGLPLMGLVAVVWSSQRQGQAALQAARQALGVQPPPKEQQLLGAMLLGTLGLLIPVAILMYNAERTLLCLILGVIVPLARRQSDGTLPTWALLPLGVWSALGGLWMTALVPLLGPSLAFYVGLSWIVLSPFGLALHPLRHLLARWAERVDRLGRLARAWSVFLPVAQVARLQRRDDPQGALSTLRTRFSESLRGPLLAEALVEAGEILLELGDRRALGMFSAAARLAPGQPQPFYGLARSYLGEDHALALAYANFAEENAQRGLGGGDPAITALREALERKAAS